MYINFNAESRFGYCLRIMNDAISIKPSDLAFPQKPAIDGSAIDQVDQILSNQLLKETVNAFPSCLSPFML